MSTDYEKLRDANIERNRQIMRDLGLDSDDFKLHAAENSKEKAKTPKAPRAPAAKKRARTEGEGSPARRSARVRGEAPEGGRRLPADEREAVDGEYEEGDGGELTTVASREAHEAAEQEYLRWAGKQKKETIVGTASYSHTLKRVRTMTDPALANRIKAIERAKGQFAVVKMKLFAQVLCLEGHDDLAADATEAYKRLSAVLGEPVRVSEEGEGEGEGGEEAVQADT